MVTLHYHRNTQAHSIVALQYRRNTHRIALSQLDITVDTQTHTLWYIYMAVEIRGLALS